MHFTLFTSRAVKYCLDIKVQVTFHNIEELQFLWVDNTEAKLTQLHMCLIFNWVIAAPHGSPAPFSRWCTWIHVCADVRLQSSLEGSLNKRHLPGR